MSADLWMAAKTVGKSAVRLVAHLVAHLVAWLVAWLDDRLVEMTAVTMVECLVVALVDW
jgi:hypothetical protein